MPELLTIKATKEESMQTRVAYDHQHTCPECSQTYPGYSSQCKKEEVLMCYKCLAKSFNMTMAQQQAKEGRYE